MTHQRKRGLLFVLYPIKQVTDSRQNVQKTVDLDNPITGKAWESPQRSAKAEVPGQQHINVLRIGTDADLSGVEAYLEKVDLWSLVEFMGKQWDVVTPPAFHNGSTRNTRHWSMDLRERP